MYCIYVLRFFLEEENQRNNGPDVTVYIRAYAEQTVTERTDVYRSTRFFAPKMFFRSFKVTNANIETKLEQMCCIHTRLVVCAQEHNDFSGGSP